MNKTNIFQFWSGSRRSDSEQPDDSLDLDTLAAQLPQALAAPKLPDSFVPEIWARIEAQQSAPKSSPRMGFGVIAAAAALLVGGIIIRMELPAPVSQPVSPSQRAVSVAAAPSEKAAAKPRAVPQPLTVASVPVGVEPKTDLSISTYVRRAEPREIERLRGVRCVETSVRPAMEVAMRPDEPVLPKPAAVPTSVVRQQTSVKLDQVAAQVADATGDDYAAMAEPKTTSATATSGDTSQATYAAGLSAEQSDDTASAVADYAAVLTSNPTQSGDTSARG